MTNPSGDAKERRGPSTRAVHAGLPAARRGEPLLPGPVLAAPYHLPGDSDPAGYGRDANPTWSGVEAAVGGLDGGEAVLFASGMAAVSAVLERARPGEAVVACGDGYPGVRAVGRERLEAYGVEVRWVPSRTDAVLAACQGASLVWVETPANPLLDVVDVRTVADAARAAGALLAVDNTVCTPLGQQPLALGADFAVTSATKALGGHSDLLMGVVSVRDPALAGALRAARSRGGAITGPVEAWLLHRSLATLELRLARMSDNALALAGLLRSLPGVQEVLHPGLPDHPGHAVARRQMRHFGPLVAFVLPDAAHAERFLDACELVAQATSFGGVHSTAERRARWQGNDVHPGLIRFSAGCEDLADLAADVEQALARAQSAR